MSNKMNLYQIIANLVSTKDLIDSLYGESEQLLDDDCDECIEYLNNVIDILINYMPCISD